MGGRGEVSWGCRGYLVDRLDAAAGLAKSSRMVIYMFQVPGTHHFLRLENIKLEAGHLEGADPAGLMRSSTWNRPARGWSPLFRGEEPHLDA